MSISNLEQPNNISLFCGNFTSLNGKISQQPFTTQTINIIPSTILSNYVVPNNSCLTVEVFANGYDIAGAFINSAIAYNPYLILIKNVGGTITIFGTGTNFVTAGDVGISTANVSFTSVGNTFSIIINGVNGETINWSGNITLFF
jgi:hypothetical protein